MIKVMIVDDQELIRESLKIILSSKNDIKITSLASDGQDVLNKLEIDKPDVILMDIRMPIMDGVSCTRIIKEKCGRIPFSILDISVWLIPTISPNFLVEYPFSSLFSFSTSANSK